MGLPINVSDLLSGKVIESSRVEFKEGFNPDAVIRTICAFANDIDNIGGGYIVLGIAEDGGMVKYPVREFLKNRQTGFKKNFGNTAIILNHCMNPQWNSWMLKKRPSS